MKTLSKIAGVALLATLGGVAQATTIDFTGAGGGSTLTYTEDDYTITGEINNDLYIGEHYKDYYGIDTDAAIILGDGQSLSISGSGQKFSFTSYDYAGWGRGGDNTITFTGYIDDFAAYTLTRTGDYGSIGADENYVYGKYTTFAGIPTTIDRLTIATSGGMFYLDNIVLTEVTSAVPETSTWAMMLAGFTMMSLALRTRHRSTKSAYA